ncbi:general negative regulator of transcription sub 2 [Enterospora canceri]|uniref:General negative regulator of transcription sub 2 n=1 Tax=Enterospora canceri TaxID=1081671 RepID=A0A1Y1S5X1_9MICR|nr:general negative regulator of transcription sub 2 [Enterospora canceri]
MRELKDMLKLMASSSDIENEEIDKIAQRSTNLNYFTDMHTETALRRMRPKCYSEITKPTIKIECFNEETLFYIFYAMNETEMQIRAYNQIIDKGYYYSTQLEEFVILGDTKCADNQTKTILVFNPYKWEKENVDILFDDAFINSLVTTKIPV